MARVNNLSNFLTDVASAIKTKKGSETAIPAASFDTEILALPSQGTYEQRVLNISANGTQTITPSSGYDAIDELELTVAVPEKQLQSKTYNFIQNTNIQLLPDTGYDGFDSVTLNINVPSQDSGNTLRIAEIYQYLDLNSENLNTLSETYAEYISNGELDKSYIHNIYFNRPTYNTIDISGISAAGFPRGGEIFLFEANPYVAHLCVPVESAINVVDKYFVYFNPTYTNAFVQLDSAYSIGLVDMWLDKHPEETLESLKLLNGWYEESTNNGGTLTSIASIPRIHAIMISDILRISMQDVLLGNDAGTNYINLSDINNTLSKTYYTIETAKAEPNNVNGYNNYEDLLKIASGSHSAEVTYRQANHAYVSDILEDRVAFGGTGLMVGTMPNNGRLNYQPSETQQTIPEGYTLGGTISAAKLGGKVVSPTTQQQNITPLSGYYGLSSVIIRPVTSDIDGNIQAENIKKDVEILGVTGTYEGSGQQINNQDKTITQNGTYQADSGYTGLGTVTVNVPQQGGSGDVKLFETEQAMQNDPNPQEGDLAVVYRNEMIVPSPGDTINSFSPPNTVVFDTPITSSVSLVLRSGPLYLVCVLNATSFAIRDMRGSVTPNAITYTSSDEITYTRTDSGETSYDLGEDVTISSTADTNILKFLQSGGMVFEGLYEYKTNQYVIADTQLTATPENVYAKTFYGKNGIEIGNIQNNKNLDMTTLRDRIITIYDSIVKSTLANDITDLSSMFERCSDIITIPLFDTSNVTNMYRMFNLCQNLIEIPLLDTSNVTNMNGMFANCDELTTIPQLDTSNVTNMNNMFQSCDKLITIPSIDTSKVTDMNSMFSSCKSLTSIPQLDTSNVTNMTYMFEYCTALTTVPQLDTSKVTNMFDVFNGCTSLSNESLNNILAMCIGATSYTSTKTLKYVMGLTEAQATTCQSLSNYSAFISAGWTTGY